MLLSNLWDAYGNFVDENTLRVQIKRLRQKIEADPKSPEYVITVFGIGYTFGSRIEKNNWRQISKIHIMFESREIKIHNIW